MPEPISIQQEIAELEALISSVRKMLTGDALEQALLPLEQKRNQLVAQLNGTGAIAQDGSKAIGQQGVMVEGSNTIGDIVTGIKAENVQVVYAAEGARLVIGDQPVEMKAELRNKALGRYLEHIIAHNRYLQLQGIRSGGKLINIELEQIYITLRTTQKGTMEDEENWLKQERESAPGELHTRIDHLATETISIKVQDALATHRHLVVLGDPGSGKTTLLRYLALLYARDLAQGSSVVRNKLKLDESGHLPILLPLRQIGAFLKAHRPNDDGTEGHALLLQFLLQSLKNHKLDLPENFFDSYLEHGKAIVLLDGLDEVSDPELRARVGRLVESFTFAYPDCRIVVTSRIIGYVGAARLQADYTTTTVQDFTLGDVRQFLTHWHTLVAVGQMGVGVDAENFAVSQTNQLLDAIEKNDRVRELAINPLMLTVIALVHRDRVRLPDRRAELYAEAIDVLLGKWDEARGVDEIRILEDRPFDAGDRRLLLQNIALHMHQRGKKELEGAELRGLLQAAFKSMVTDESSARRAVVRFLTVIEERTGLVSARGEGVYAFSHLTFQEYLAALAVASRDDYVQYILHHSGEAWWREVILLTAGYLSTQSRERTTRFIREIADKREEPEPYYNLVLAVECLRDVGENRVEGNLGESLSNRLLTDFQTRAPEKLLDKIQLRISQGMKPEDITRRRVAAASALAQIGGGRRVFWSLPHGEPEWITIQASEFWMGSEKGVTDEKPVHRLYLPEFQISCVPITNAQYEFFVKATKHKFPSHWVDGRVPKGLENHPVVNISWFDAIGYCTWMSEVTGKPVTLPSEAEWEKAARGDQDPREYPWGDDFDASRCNSLELGLQSTTPVGIFLDGASPYGVLDLSGNVWEWTRSIFAEGDFQKLEMRNMFQYPYNPVDGREDLSKSSNFRRVLRGGSIINESGNVRCALRGRSDPVNGGYFIGFRVVVSPMLLS
jgi:formylglycine-generating enzyme required for sulfatase activity